MTATFFKSNRKTLTARRAERCSGRKTSLELKNYLESLVHVHKSTKCILHLKIHHCTSFQGRLTS